MGVADQAKEALTKESGNGGANKTPVPKTLMGLKSEGIKDIFQAYRLQIAQVLPKHVTAERIIQIATTVFARNPDLQKCTTGSIIGAVLQSAMLGLDPTPQLGQCYFVPYANKKTGKTDCQFQIGYIGRVNLAMRSDTIESVSSYVVHANDEFEYELGLEPKLKHKPALDNRGEKQYVYAVWKFKDGGYYFEVMTKEEVMSAKAVSQASGSKFSPWNTAFEAEMWRKTVIKRSSKYVPLSIEVQNAYATDEQTINPDNFDDLTKEIDVSTLPEVDEVVEEPEPNPEPETETKEPDTTPEKEHGFPDEISDGDMVSLTNMIADSKLNRRELAEKFGLNSIIKTTLNRKTYNAIHEHLTNVILDNERGRISNEEKT